MTKRLITFIPLLLLSTLFLNGCVKDNTPPPSPLTKNLPMQFSPSIVWKTDATYGTDTEFLTLAPALWHNTLVTAGYRGEVVALRQTSGNRLWVKRFDAAFTSTPLIHNNTVYVGTLKGFLYAINLKNGALRWKAALPSSLFATPAGHENIIVAHVHNDDIMAFDSESGKVLWHKPGSSPSLMLQGDSAPVIHDDAVYVGLSTGFLSAYDLSTGDIKWDRPISLPTSTSAVANIMDIAGQPAIKLPFIYAVSYQGNVAALNMDSGKTLWQHSLSSYKPISATQDKLIVTSANSNIYALDRETGKVLWVQKKLAYRHLSAPSVMGDNIVVGDFAGYLHFLSTQDGHINARLKLSRQGIRAQPIVSGKMLYVNTIDGDVFAVKQ